MLISARRIELLRQRPGQQGGAASAELGEQARFVGAAEMAAWMEGELEE